MPTVYLGVGTPHSYIGSNSGAAYENYMRNYGGGVSAGQQANALRNPAPLTTTTAVNPMQKTAFDDAKKYSNSLLNSTNEMVTREVGRARDDISTGMRAEGEAAMGRGADPSFFRSRALSSGARDIGNLQAKLADVNLGRQAEGIGLETGAAGGAAHEQNTLTLGTQANQLGAQRNLLDEAEFEQRVQQQPYDNLMAMLNAAGNQSGNYDFSGLSGYGGGSGGLMFGRVGGSNPMQRRVGGFL